MIADLDIIKQIMVKEFDSFTDHAVSQGSIPTSTVSIICDWIGEKGALRAKRDFCLFSTYHHFKAVRALGFRLGLLAVWAFYFTDPMLEA